MVIKSLSVEEVQKKLEKVVQEFDWLDEFLGHNQNSFLRTYRTFYAQLKEGDRLEIEIKKDEHSCNRADISYPKFQIVHYKNDGSKRVVHTCDSNGYGISIANLLLYED